MKLALEAAAASTLLAACREEKASGDGKRLNIFAWADYFHPDCIPEFEKRTGIKVIYDTFASNEQLLAKLQAGATEYDIVMPSNYIVQEFIKLDLLATIDHERLRGIEQLQERFQNPAFDPHLAHAVPQFWGTTGIACNVSALDAGMPVPDNWEAFWDKRFARRMTLLDDARETIGMSLKRMGHSYNTQSDDEVRAATQELIKQKPNTPNTTSDQVIVQLAAADSMLALVYSGDAFQAARQNSNIRYRVPKNGTAIWVDSFCIPKHAPHPDSAYEWINYMLDPQVAAFNAKFNKYACANAQARKYLSKEEVSDPDRYPPEHILARCEDLVDLGKMIFLYDRMWTELKCT